MADVLSYELAAIPPSLFDEKNGSMRLSTKSTIKSKLQVEASTRSLSPPDCIILDGCAVLWVVRWPSKGKVEDYVKSFVDYVENHLRMADTYLVFDRYYERSIKEGTRKARAGRDASRRHKLSLSTPLPAQKVCLTVTENKVQLIDIICQYLNDYRTNSSHCLVVTGPDPIPLEYFAGDVRAREDLRTTHEEADVIIAQQALSLARMNKMVIKVVADDTNIFILLLYIYHTQQLTCDLLMSGTNAARSSSCIKFTALLNTDILTHLLPAHILTGCDTVSYIWGIGKSTVVKALKTGLTLSKLGCLQEPMVDVISEATKFISACYGYPGETSMTDLRFKVWSNKMGNCKLNLAPDLKVLPPTSKAFEQHVYRAHLQTAIWRSVTSADPPNANPIHYGWTLDIDQNVLVPIVLPPDVSPAPMDILKMIKCGCSKCSTARCSCSVAQISCSVF